MPDPTPPPSPSASTGDTRNTKKPYNPVFFTSDSYPSANGVIAKTFAAVPLAQQQKSAQDFYLFLWNTNGNDMLRLNSGNAILTALVAILATSMVQVVYGFGVGTAGIGEANPR